VAFQGPCFSLPHSDRGLLLLLLLLLMMQYPHLLWIVPQSSYFLPHTTA
jgi:hypothetical protein